MKKLAIVLGRGGHTAQTFALVDLLGKRFSYLYLIGILDRLTPKKIRIDGRVLRVFAPRLLPQDSRVMSVIRTLFTMLLSLIYFVICRPVAVVSCGTGITIPVFYAARVLGIKTVFIESLSRVESLSITGRLLRGKTDLFMVQWPELANRVPEAIYGGQLL
jgi:UDP-N-acetylglucosamine:LPS N-acetylglucosamine transferase